MSVIGINASPRPDGNTAKFVREVLAGAGEAGAETRMFQLGQMEIAPCIACMRCKKTAECAVKDGMQQIYGAIEAARAPRALVLGTPIYFDHISAQLKTWIDRLYSYTFTAKGQKMFPEGFRAVLIATWEAGGEHAYDSVLSWLAGRMKAYHRIEVVEKMTLADTRRRPFDKRPDIIERAREVGRRLGAEPRG